MKRGQLLVFIIVAILIVTFGIMIYFVLQNKKIKEDFECNINEDCVAATCCHSDSCVNVKDVPDCSEIICSMICSGPLDCDAGYCGCIKGRCEVISN